MIGAPGPPVVYSGPTRPLEMYSLRELSGLQVSTSLDEPFDVELDPAWLEIVVRFGLQAAEITGDAEVSLLITDDETVRSLNAEYRGLDETTDVLSFSADHPGHWEGEGDGPPEQPDTSGFVLPPGIPKPLGEIVVSWPQARRQAVEHGVSPQWELAHLVVHGALHLVGYDHLETEDTGRMQALEREALESLQSIEQVS